MRSAVGLSPIAQSPAMLSAQRDRVKGRYVASGIRETGLDG
jgi:hypothetical protein